MDKKIDILLKEYEIVVSSINDFINAQFKVLNAGIVIFSGAIIYAYVEQKVLIIPLVPFAMIVLFTYFLYRLERNSLLQEYRTYLESKITKLYGEPSEPLLFYSKIASRYLRNGNFLAILQFFYYLALYIYLVKEGSEILIKDYCYLYTRYLTLTICLLTLITLKFFHISYVAKSRFRTVLINEKHSRGSQLI